MRLPAFLEALGVEGWRPGPADPSLLGWLATLAYFGVALLLGRPWRRSRFSLFAAGLFALLGAAKLLNLQMLLIGSLRSLARSKDWYADRQLPQMAFIATVGTLTLAAMAALAWTGAGNWGRELRRRRLTVAMIVLLLGFLAIRAASLHRVDRLLYGTTIGGFQWSTVIEMGLLALIVPAALFDGGASKGDGA